MKALLFPAILSIVTSFSFSQIHVSLPVSSGRSGDTVSIMMTVGEVTDANVIAYECSLGFDHRVLSPLGVTSDGTLSGENGWSALSNSRGDTLYIAAFGASALTGGGNLLNVKFVNVGHSGATTPLTFLTFLFNNGSPSALLVNGSFTSTDPGTLGIPISDRIPAHYTLYQNYPNPFNPTTRIRFALPKVSEVFITFFNSIGQLVQSFSLGVNETGYHEMTFDAGELASGMYLYTLRAGDFVATKRLLLMK